MPASQVVGPTAYNYMYTLRMSCVYRNYMYCLGRRRILKLWRRQAEGYTYFKNLVQLFVV